MEHKNMFGSYADLQITILFSFQDMDSPHFLVETDLDAVPLKLGKDIDHLKEFTFPKFAATYFQGSATDNHIRKTIYQPLLYHEDQGDVLVLVTVLTIICLFCFCFFL